MAHPIEKEQEEVGFFDRGIGYVAKKTGQTAMWTLGKYGEGLDWTNEQFKLRNTPLGSLAEVTGLDKNKYVSGALDYSYGDLREDAAEGAGTLTEQALKAMGRSPELAESWGKGVEIAGQILIPDAVDYLGGVGYVDNLARAAQKLPDLAGGIDKLSSSLSKTIPDSRVLATDVGPMTIRQADQFTSANTFAIKSKGGGGVKKVERLVDPNKLVGDRALKSKIAFDAEHFGKSADEIEEIVASGIDSYSRKGGIGMTMRHWIGGKDAGINKGQKIGLQGSTHHFGMDLDLAGHTLNTTDNHIVSKLLREKLDVFPGDHRNNFIMAYHDNTKLLSDAAKHQLTKWTGKSKREVIDFMKNLPEGSTLGRAELAGKSDWKVMDMLESLKDTKTRNWNKFLEGSGKKITDLDLPAPIMGVDHQDLIHGAIDTLPSRVALIKFAQTDDWLKLSPESRALRIAEVAEKQQNIALRVNKWRLDKILKRMSLDEAPGFTKGKFTGDWSDVQVWMMKNPHLASSLDWHKTAQIGTGMTLKELTKPLNVKEAAFVASVFNLEKVPRTGTLMKKLKKAKNIQELTGRVTHALAEVGSNGFAP